MRGSARLDAMPPVRSDPLLAGAHWRATGADRLIATKAASATRSVTLSGRRHGLCGSWLRGRLLRAPG